MVGLTGWLVLVRADGGWESMSEDVEDWCEVIGCWEGNCMLERREGKGRAWGGGLGLHQTVGAGLETRGAELGVPLFLSGRRLDREKGCIEGYGACETVGHRVGEVERWESAGVKFSGLCYLGGG